MKNLLFILLTSITFTCFSQNYSVGNYQLYQDGEIIYALTNFDSVLVIQENITIKYVAETDENGRSAFESEYALTYMREVPTGYIDYRLPVTADYITICSTIANDSRVDNFEISTNCKLLLDPNDPQENNGNQWYLETMNAYNAWDITTGSEDIIVCVIDSGFDWDVEDLGDENANLENIFHNPGEDAWDEWDEPDSGDEVDGNEATGEDDSSSYIDDWKGMDMYDIIDPPEGDNDTRHEPNHPKPHGTWVSSLICAQTNNGIEMAGFAAGNYAENKRGIQLLLIKVSGLDANGEMQTNSDALDDAMYYAVEMGARVISFSISPQLTPSSFVDAIEDIYANHNVLITGAPGNHGDCEVHEMMFPAAHPDVIAVGATNQDDFRWFKSAYQPDDEWDGFIDIVAPGVDMTVMDTDGNVIIKSGTSASTPLAAATIGLMLSINPELDNITVRNILRNTAEKVHPDHYDYDEDGDLEVGWGRINAFAACSTVLYNPQYAPGSVYITENKTWLTQREYYSDLIIEPGATLTIKDVLNMRVGTKIIIKPQGKLVVDGGKITSKQYIDDPELQWTGIEVWGTDDSQYADNGVINQGKLVLKNEAIIENAEKAISVYEPDANGDPTSNTTGGIVEAENASFINCKRVAKFHEYHNYPIGYPEIEASNRSYFHNCNFEINANFLGGSIDMLNDLYDVKGVDFKGCTFINDFNNTPTGKAILALDAGFDVTFTVMDTPPFDTIRSAFENFTRAVSASHTQTSTYTVNVNRTDFISNSSGVWLSGTDNATILNSNFYLGYANTGLCSSSNSYGVELFGCTGFAIEENFFSYWTGPLSDHLVGVRVYDSQTSYDEIYKNDFAGLTEANLSEGKNYGNSDIEGLCYYCNKNNSNERDFEIIPKNGNPNSGIQKSQGDRNNATGNFFSNNALWHINNEGDHEVYYYCCTAPYGQVPQNYVYTDPRYAPYNPCPSHYGGGSSAKGSYNPIILNEEEYLERVATFVQAFDNFESVKTLFDTYEDGGNTEALKTDIETSFPIDMWELRSQLLGNSPHLSQEILKTTVDKTDVFPESVLFEILSANPDELGNEELMTYLEDKEDPLPQYMIDILRQMDGEITYKTILQQEMSKYNSEKALAAHDIIRSNLNSETENTDELINWLGNLQNQKADEQIIELYIQKGDFQSAESLLNLLSELYQLEGVELDNFNDYKSLKQMQIQLKVDERNIFDLSDTESNTLYALAENDNTAALQAQSILSYVYDEDYCHCPNFDGGNKTTDAEIPANPLSKIVQISAKPNPANEWVAFNYEKLFDVNARLIVSDALGKEINSFEIEDMQGQLLLDVRAFNPGIYFYTLISGDYSHTEKLIIK